MPVESMHVGARTASPCLAPPWDASCPDCNTASVCLTLLTGFDSVCRRKPTKKPVKPVVTAPPSQANVADPKLKAATALKGGFCLESATVSACALT